MTEAVPAFDADEPGAQIQAQHTARDHLAEEFVPGNKAALFDALAAAGITSVVVTFDGGGDEGQIEDIDARSGEEKVDLPLGAVEIATPTWDGTALDRRTLMLGEAIEDLAYAMLRETHPGWEINDGAFGEFRFDVAARSITLEHNSRFIDVQTFEHEW